MIKGSIMERKLVSCKDLPMHCGQGLMKTDYLGFLFV